MNFVVEILALTLPSTIHSIPPIFNPTLTVTVSPYLIPPPSDLIALDGPSQIIPSYAQY